MAKRCSHPLLPGSRVGINLCCGCDEERIVTLMRGTQIIPCSDCGTRTFVRIYECEVRGCGGILKMNVGLSHNG